MMSKSGPKIKLKGIKQLEKALKREKVKGKVKTALENAVVREAHLLRRDSIQYIDSEGHGVPNSPLTVLAKGSDKPLVDRGDLRQSISVGTSRLPKVFSASVGVKRSTGRGEGADIAPILHNGAVIKVTPEVRAAAFAAIRERTGRPVQMDQGGGAKKSWIIKPRPFLKDPLDAAEMRIKRSMANAIKSAIEGM